MAKVQLERRQRLVDVCKSIIADPRNVDDDVVSAFKRAALKYVATQYADTTQGFRDLYKVKGKPGDLVRGAFAVVVSKSQLEVSLATGALYSRTRSFLDVINEDDDEVNDDDRVDDDEI